MQYIADVGNGMFIGIARVNDKWKVRTEKPVEGSVVTSTKTFTKVSRMLRYVTRKTGKLPFIDGLTDSMSNKTMLTNRFDAVIMFTEIDPDLVRMSIENVKEKRTEPIPEGTSTKP
jgi:hypothetical protein